MNLWTETDILFALFILKANHYIYEDFIKFDDVTDDYICSFVGMIYADLFADRGIVEEEFEGWVESCIFDMCKSRDIGIFGVRGWSGLLKTKKIKFRFVEEE